MTRIAAGSEMMDPHDWMPSRIYLSVPLMWDVLQFNCEADTQNTPTAPDLLDPSLAPKVPRQDLQDEDALLEIVVASSPEITVDTKDGGQDAPSFSRPAPVTATPRSTSRSVNNGNGGNRGMMIDNNPSQQAPGQQQHQHQHQQHQQGPFEQTDTLTFNTTPWLYADPSQFLSLGDLGWNESSQGNMGGDGRGAPWWEEGSFNNAMFS
jgi:hypothetical protein